MMKRNNNSLSEFAEEEKKESEPGQTSSSDPKETVSNENRPLSNNSDKKIKEAITAKKPSSTIEQSLFKKLLSFVGTMLRIVFIDIALAALFALLVTSFLLGKFTHEYLLPAGKLMTWNTDRSLHELTYFHRYCDENDQSTDNPADLLIAADMTAENATKVMLTHGAAMYPNLLSEETATELREFILEQNKKNENMIYVIENTQRWSFYLKVDQHPAVSKALHEVLNTNPLLIESLEMIAGENPSVIEFTTITSAYGAAAQHWHQDVVPETNGAKYSRNFVPSYSLFIPLQNTTAAMGATGLCPGTTMCAEGCGEFCAETGFQLSGATPEGNWPVGWGALVNQQTTHMGSAHSDPNGPHRVVMVITFAPRPRFGPHELETRMIGMGGSYSLHWSQWGHTLRDFSDPTLYMRQPWRTLRSLGLYKPPGTDWGWDFVTQTLQRVVNEDVGYSLEDLMEFVDNGGFFFLPKQLQGQLPPGEVNNAPVGWIQILQNTIERLLELVRLAYFGYLLLSFVIILAVAASGKKSVSRALSLIVQIAMLHLFIITLALSAWKTMENGSWALNVRRSAQFRVPSGPHPMYPDIPASLPLNEDVLILNEMKSSYMASFTDVLEVVHPGNTYFATLIDGSSKGYLALPTFLQERIRTGLVDALHTDKRRIMTKNADGNWAEVDQNHAIWYCHKQLSARDSAFVDLSMQYLDHALVETRFGYLRHTALHQKHIPMLLLKLQSEILGLSSEPKVSPIVGTPLQISSIQSSLPQLRTEKSARTRERNRFLPSREVVEPFPGAWLAEGDEVEALYTSDSREWYKATIVFASSDRYTWTVEFDDGDFDSNLCARCVRPFVPYHVGERVEVRVSDDEFAAGEIESVNAWDETYDVKLEDGEIVSGASGAEIRRIDIIPMKEVKSGDRVLAMFPGQPDEWFPGIVERENKDGSFAIQYDDGDYAPRVMRQQVRSLEQ